MDRFLFLLMAFMFGGHLAHASAGITYHGRLLKSNGTPVTSPSVTFKLQIRTPGAENCLLYEEQQVKDLSTSNGVFALAINDGTASAVNTEPFTLDRVFQNRGTFSFAGGKCTGGPTYAPNPTDGRKLAVEFNDGTFAPGTWEQIPAQNINYVPMAIESMTVGGFNASNLHRVVDGAGAPVVVSPLTQTQHNALLDLANGAGSIVSGQIPAGAVTDAKIDTVSGSKVTGNITGNAAGFTGSLAGDVTGAQGATAVVRLQGRAIDTSAPTNGQALLWDAADNRWEPGNVATSTDWTAITGKPSTFPSDWSTLANIPGTFSPSAHTHPVNQITSSVGAYFTYRPNNGACAVGEVLKWESTGGGRWACGTDISSTGGTGVSSVSATAPVTVDNTDPNNPRVEIDDATTTTTGVVQLATSSDTAANLVVQANDTRLTDSRAPNGAAGGELSGTYPNPTVVASTTTTNNSLVRRDGSGNISGAAGNFGSLILNNGGGSTISVQTPAAFTSYVLKLPTGTGTNGQILTSNGSDMVWSTPSYMAAVAPGANGNVLVSNGTSWTSGAVPADSTKVSKSGDTMSGALTLPANGLAVGTTQLVVSGGNVGIGEANPSAPLTVQRALATNGTLALFGDSTSNVGLSIRSNTSIPGLSSKHFDLQGSSSGSDFSISPSTSYPAALVVKGNSGNVGIGTSAPAASLHVVDASTSHFPLLLNDGAYTYGFGYGAGAATSGRIFNFGGQSGSSFISVPSSLQIREGGTTRVTVANGGAVGIGTATPEGLFDVFKTTTANNVALQLGGQFKLTDSGNVTATGNFYKYGGVANALASGTVNSSGAVNSLAVIGFQGLGNFTGTMSGTADTLGVYGGVFDAGGNLGTTGTTGHSGVAVTSKGTADLNVGVGINDVSGATSNVGLAINSPTVAAANWALYSPSSAQSYFAGKVGVGTLTPVAKLDVVGDAAVSVSVSSPAFYYTSDRRLKNDVRTLENPLETIFKLRGVSFNWSTTHQPDVGFIAQEVEAVVPELVRTGPGAAGPDTKSVKYGNVVALVVEAIKELGARLAGFDERVAALEASNDLLAEENRRLRDEIQARDTAFEQRLKALEKRSPTGGN